MFRRIGPGHTKCEVSAGFADLSVKRGSGHLCCPSWMPSNIQHLRFCHPQQFIQVIMGKYLGTWPGGRAAAAGDAQTKGFCRALAVDQRGDEARDHGVS